MDLGNGIVTGYGQRPKVLRWPRRNALIGYVGVAQIGGIPADEWLCDFIGDNLDFTSFENLSEKLRTQVEAQRRIDGGSKAAQGLIIHLGGFEERQGVQVPSVWVVRNIWGHNDPVNVYETPRKEFQIEECFKVALPHILPKDLRAYFEMQAAEYNPYWFHQGIDLKTFNQIESFLKAAFKDMCKKSLHPFPTTLADWENQVRMSILTYGAYFQAYKQPNEQLVGGGVDIVSIGWP